MSKIALGFVVFNPPSTLLARFELALAADWELFIYDNSPTDGRVRSFCAARKKTYYFTSGKNAGLGYGMSTVAAQAYYGGHTVMLFFDQDTDFTHNTLAFVSKFYRLKGSLANSYSSVVFNAKRALGEAASSEFVCRDVLLSISSGSLYFLENLRRLNWFDESFFVDCVDYEFCLRSRIANFKTGACLNTPGYDHETEQDDSTYWVFGKLRRLRKYSRSRVRGTIHASLRLCWRSAIRADGRYLWTLLRSLGGYVLWQIVVRVLITIPRLGRSRTSQV
jgi:GT2 family glycosyltransferase